VAGGIADYVDAPAATVRWIVAIATILSLGIGALIYALLWLLLPRSGGAADPR
jgi:phage shock protein PspC (stress-responsive transcriptional regulator)